MFNITNLLILALITVFVVFRLLFSLGRYEDEDEAISLNKKMKTIDPIDEPSTEDVASKQIALVQKLDKASQSALEGIMKLDDKFSLNNFTTKASAAFEYILDLYCKQNLDELKDLTSPEVMSSFEKQIKNLKSSNSMIKIVIVSISESNISQIKLEGKCATIEMEFESHQIEYKTDLEGNIISGNSSNVFKKHDSWTFSKELDSSSPNWLLIST